MGLIIKSENIEITGTSIKLPEVYGRIEFAGRANGKTLEIGLTTYASKQAFKSGASVISTNVPMGNITAELQESQLESVETAHEYAKLVLENQGFDVTLDL